MPTFTTTLISGGGNTCGIEIPADVVEALGGKRVPVVITLGGTYTYSTRRQSWAAATWSA